MEIKQTVFAELDAATPGHAILASNTSSLSITEIGEATLRPEQGRRLPLLLPGLDHAADRDRRGRGDLRRDGRRGAHVRPGDPQAADHLRRGSRLRRQPHPQLGHLGDLARAGGEGPFDQADRRGRRRAPAWCRSGPTSWSTCSASTPSCTWPSTSSSPTARNASTCPRACRSWSPKASSAPRPAATASTTRRASRTSPATPSPTSPSSSSCCR